MISTEPKKYLTTVCVAQGPQRPALHDSLYPQGGGKEASPPDVGRVAGRDRDGYHSIRNPLRSGHLLQLPWEIPLGGGQQLDSGGPQPLEGTEKVGAAVYGVDQGG